MPFNAPQSLTPDQVYAVSAYVLYLNNLVPQDAVLDARDACRKSKCQTGPISSARLRRAPPDRAGGTV